MLCDLIGVYVSQAQVSLHKLDLDEKNRNEKEREKSECSPVRSANESQPELAHTRLPSCSF